MEKHLYCTRTAGAPLAPGMYRPLSAPAEAWHFVMAAPPDAAASKTLDVTFTADGRCNAVVFWYALDLGGGRHLSSGRHVSGAGGGPPGAPPHRGARWRLCCA